MLWAYNFINRDHIFTPHSTPYTLTRITSSVIKIKNALLADYSVLDTSLVCVCGAFVCCMCAWLVGVQASHNLKIFGWDTKRKNTQTYLYTTFSAIKHARVIASKVCFFVRDRANHISGGPRAKYLLTFDVLLGTKKKMLSRCNDASIMRQRCYRVGVCLCKVTLWDFPRFSTRTLRSVDSWPLTASKVHSSAYLLV